jgi:IS30 family transposase
MGKGKHYKHLSITERCEISRLQKSGYSIRKIAESLDRTPSSIARELKRNTRHKDGYNPEHANRVYHAKRWGGSKLDRDDNLREKVLSMLKEGYSPEQVSGRLKLETGKGVISYETIYRFIYAQVARTKDYNWRHYLPQGKSKRRSKKSRKNCSSEFFITDRVPILYRPPEIDERKEAGHWEADLMLFSKFGQILLMLFERHTRVLIVKRVMNKSSNTVIDAISDTLSVLPRNLRQTVTFDNGSEFAYHYKLHKLGMETFFCDTYSPWQKGGIENAIGRVRRFLPRKTDLEALSNSHFLSIIQTYNNTPRKCLNYQTPSEVFLKDLLNTRVCKEWGETPHEVLHFKREYTDSRSSRE